MLPDPGTRFQQRLNDILERRIDRENMRDKENIIVTSGCRMPGRFSGLLSTVQSLGTKKSFWEISHQAVLVPSIWYFGRSNVKDISVFQSVRWCQFLTHSILIGLSFFYPPRGLSRMLRTLWVLSPFVYFSQHLSSEFILGSCDITLLLSYEKNSSLFMVGK